jgi:hypothetical protein
MHRFTLFIFATLYLTACVTPQRKTPVPVFPLKTIEPIAIRITDSRPKVERGQVRDAKWIYFQAAGSEQSDLLIDYLGSALTALNAAPGYIVVNEDASDSAARVLIDIDYQKGYARWPVDVDQRGNEVAVEGATRIDYTIYVDGERVQQGLMNEAPPDFRVPVGIIRQNNVRQVVSDALAYQFDKATTDLLDEFLWLVADAWPKAYRL